MRWISSRRVRALVVVTCGVFAAGAFVGGRVLATDSFSDVPDSAFFHDDVTWLADNGVTTGCGGTKYCPSNFVTRGQMAAFMHRLVSRDRFGFFSCPGSTFEPVKSDITYDTSTSLLFRTGGTSNLFRCNAVLPDGSTILAILLSARDSDGTNDVDCSLRRTDLVDVIGGEDELATLATAATPGDTTVDTDVISDPFVDNASFAFFLQCAIEGTDSTVGLFGMSILYVAPGVPLP